MGISLCFTSVINAEEINEKSYDETMKWLKSKLDGRRLPAHDNNPFHRTIYGFSYEGTQITWKKVFKKTESTLICKF